MLNANLKAPLNLSDSKLLSDTDVFEHLKQFRSFELVKFKEAAKAVGMVSIDPID